MVSTWSSMLSSCSAKQGRKHVSLPPLPARGAHALMPGRQGTELLNLTRLILLVAAPFLLVVPVCQHSDGAPPSER